MPQVVERERPVKLQSKPKMSFTQRLCTGEIFRKIFPLFIKKSLFFGKAREMHKINCIPIINSLIYVIHSERDYYYY